MRSAHITLTACDWPVDSDRRDAHPDVEHFLHNDHGGDSKDYNILPNMLRVFSVPHYPAQLKGKKEYKCIHSAGMNRSISVTISINSSLCSNKQKRMKIIFNPDQF